MGLSWLDKSPLYWVGQHGHVRFDQCALTGDAWAVRRWVG
jgi:hypothetical protein